MKTTVRTLATSAALLVAAAAGDLRVRSAPPPKAIELVPLGVYRTGLFDEGAVEIAAYDADTRRVFLTFAAQARLDIVDIQDPLAPAFVASIDLTPWGDGAHATSVAVRSGVVAVAVPQGEDDTGLGKVLFFDAFGALLNQVTVGALPDMLTFTPNGGFVLTANEGQPNQAYTFDPEGSVSIIDLRGGVASLTQADVSTAGFASFNSVPLDPSIRIFGPGATVAQDLEPEYLAVSHDSRTAWVTLQENNALAVVDLTTRTVTSLVGLGFKDHSLDGNGFDGGRDDRTIAIRQWPIRGMYQPDAIATFRHHAETYLVTANEGDVRQYAGLNAPKPSDTDDESAEIEDIALDPLAFPNGAALESRANGIGRLKITSFDGDVDGDGDYDELYSFGARSVSIWSIDGRLVFDSGDDLEQLTATAVPSGFNASNANNTRDDRSDDKGPEPEGVTVAHVFGRTYLFVMLERVGGIVVYELGDPRAPRFVQYINVRNFTAAPGTPDAGDLGPEAARFIPAESSPIGAPLLAVSNEASGSLRIYRIDPK
jgi:hypothetical protein